MDKIGRNDPCPCGSGKKYKQCCLNKPKPPRFKATLLSQPKQVDLMARTFGGMIAEADRKASQESVSTPPTGAVEQNS